ncbi:hypothetical protein GYB22_07295 [bacterium]|nr:hypothetical protein [bacterium]
MIRIKLVLLAITLLATLNLKAQVSGYPNVQSDDISTKPMWYALNIPITLPGAIGLTFQAQHIKPNSIYANVNGGVGYIFNLSQAYVEEKNKNFKPMGSVEFGYALGIGKRGNSRKLLTGEYEYMGDGNTGQKYYGISVPHHVLLIPVVGFNYDPIVAKVSSYSNRVVGNKGRYSVALPSLNFGVKLFGANRTSLKFKDSKSGEVYEGVTQQLGGIYAGVKFALSSELEVPNGFTSILKSQGPSFELYGILPAYLNSSGTAGFGIRSVPYTRDATLKPGSTERISTSAGYQLFINYCIYL